jgi:deoxyribodipyrimidine photo-lyase
MSTMSSDKDTANKKRKLDSDDQLKENGEPAVKKTSTEDFEQKIKDTRMSVCGSVAEFKFNKKRVRVLSKTQDFPDESNGVVYWMSRDQRVQGDSFHYFSILFNLPYFKHYKIFIF